MVRPLLADGRRFMTVCATTSLLSATLSVGAVMPGVFDPASAMVGHGEPPVSMGTHRGELTRQDKHLRKSRVQRAGKQHRSKTAKARASAKARAAAKAAAARAQEAAQAKAKAAANAKAVALIFSLLQNTKPVPGPILLPHPTPTPTPTPTTNPTPTSTTNPTTNPSSSSSSPSNPSGNQVPWAAPTLAADHVTVNVTDTAATRKIKLEAGQDALIVLPYTPLTDYMNVGLGDAMVTVTGGRNVVVMGGHIQVQRAAVTHLTTGLSTDGMTLTVSSTAGYPASGVVRVDGESINYSSKDSTHFYVSARRKGYYNTSAVSSETTHAAGAQVYIGEAFRSGMSFQRQTGTVHVEGVAIDGFVNDGIRVVGGQAILQVENSRIGPNTNYDLAYQTDGHPDGIQAYGGGAREVRLAGDTFVVGPNGNGLLNRGSDGAGGHAVEAWRLRDVEVLSTDGKARSLIANTDTSSTWVVENGSLRYPSGFTKTAAPNIASKFSRVTYQSGQSDVAPSNRVGNGYRSAQ